MTKVLRIASKREGYRRCGIGHSEQAVDHAIDLFNEDQIAILKADPNLVVQEVDEGAAAEGAAAKDDIAQLRSDAAADRTKADEELDAATKAREAAEADRRVAADEKAADSTAAAEAKADRTKAADELATAKKVREEAEKSSLDGGKDDKSKGGKKAG